MKFFNLNKKYFTTAIAYHIYLWIIIAIIIFMIGIALGHKLYSGFGLTVSMLLFMIVPVYQHFYILKKFFNNRKYVLYVFWLIIIIITNAFIGYYSLRALFGLMSNVYQYSLDILVILVISTAIQFAGQGFINKIRFYKLKTNQAELELYYLKAQLNPHFLFNSLNNIYSLSLKYNNPLSDVIMKLSDLMRYILDSSKKREVSLKDEYEFISNYIGMEKLRLRENSIIKIETNGSLAGIKIAPMLLLPFVENIFKHGISPVDGELEAEIELNILQKKIHFKTKNKNFHKDFVNNVTVTKIGLENVKKRLELLYPNKYNLEIINNNSIFEVNLMLEI